MNSTLTTIDTDEKHMLRSMELAQLGKGRTASNPMVGAVLVADGRVIAEGWHHYYGADHAEVNCLKHVAGADKHLIAGATMYVNLEPCAHYGITPPCATRLVEEKIGKVVISNVDPFKLVSGEGIAILQKAGIEVVTGICSAEGLWMNRRFFCYYQQKRPYIILKWAQTKDGFIAPADRSRFQITGPDCMQLTHRWRTEEAAIMVGATTALNDDPELTARLWQGRQPLRIVFDRKLQLPPTHHIFDDAAATWVINEVRETMHGNIHSIKLPFDDTLLPHLMQRLYDAKMLSVIIEGGAVLLNSFISTGLWDEARVFTGAVSLGNGVQAPSLNDGIHASSAVFANDTLNVVVNKNSAYPYVTGMDL